MDKYLVRKDVYDEIEKAVRDRSHLVQKPITDKNGHQRKVWVRSGEEPKSVRTKKVEEPTEKRTAKPKFEVDSKVTLDGAKGDFKVTSIDKDGAYHVVSADGKKGYKVSENHITGSAKESGTKDYSAMSKDELLQAYNSTKDMDERDKIMAAFENADKQPKQEAKKEPAKNKAQKLFDAEDKAFAESEKDAQNKYGKMSVNELEKLMQKYSGARKYTPEYNEAAKINDVLQQKKKEMSKQPKKQLEPTYGRKQIPADQFVAAEYKKAYDDDKIDTTYAGIEEALRQAEELPIVKRHPEFMMKLRNDLMKAEKEPETVTKYRLSGEGAESVYTPKRAEIHEKIINNLIKKKMEAAKPKNGEAPTFQILGGRGGSGKSTFNKKKSDAGVYHEDNVIVVDPDALKQELAKESGDGWEGWKAKAYHEESSDLSKKLMKAAMALGLNVVMDITMSSADKQIDELKLAKQMGYKTGAYYMHVPKQESFKRAMKRYIESETEKGVEDFSGRLVPPDVLLGMTGNEANFDKVKDFADDWSFYDNFIPFEKDPKTDKNKYKAEKIAQKGE